MKNIDEYLIVVAPLPEEDGGGFIARVPDLPGCFGDGKSHEDAIKDVIKAMAEWTDEYEKMGREIPCPGSFAKECQARRLEEIKFITALRDRLRDREEEFQNLDSRLNTIESDVQHLLDILDNNEAWERFDIITKTTRSRQRELSC